VRGKQWAHDLPLVHIQYHPGETHCLTGQLINASQGETMHKYSPLFFATLATLCVLGFILAGTASALPQYPALSHILNALGSSILVADMVLVLIADWRGFTSLNGRINWGAMSDLKRVVLGVVFVILSPLALIVYLAQIARSTAPAASHDTQP
jgi:hypothetical protein